MTAGTVVITGGIIAAVILLTIVTVLCCCRLQVNTFFYVIQEYIVALSCKKMSVFAGVFFLLFGIIGVSQLFFTLCLIIFMSQ